jgi:branched-chain amino acid transport system substrate-binding protein
MQVQAVLFTATLVTLLTTIDISPTQADITIAVVGPMSVSQAWFGEQFERGAGMAATDLNAKRGVLGHKVDFLVADDFCDPDQAVAAANKLVGSGVVFVVGHWCSHSSIPASKVYEKAEVLMISPGSASAKLTDEGGPNVFRVYGRDDRQGAIVGDYFAEHWADKEIAVLDDGTTWGAGVANAVRRRLHERDVQVAVDETIISWRTGIFRAGLEDAGRWRRYLLSWWPPPRDGFDLPPGARPRL